MLKIAVGLLIGCAVSPILLFSLIALRGIKAADPPGKWETRIVSSAKHRLFVGNRKTQNPLAATAENISAGRESFSHYCYVCHGLDGQGSGVPFFDVMSPPTPSLASQDVQAYGDGQLYWVIENGLWPSGMPAAKGILTEEEMWSIVLYIRHLPPAGSLGDPPAFTDDCRASPPVQ
jgi:mono/diheme cytochrome c family protein